MSSDRIEKTIVLKAPRARVWKAIGDQTEFGAWFGVRLPEGSFQPGATVSGNITHEGYEHLVMTIEIVEVVPEQKLSYRWHPHAIDPQIDYAAETPTLVTFTLEDVPEGTRLTVVESGFDKLPPHRREEAWRGNEPGWTAQMQNVERHVSR